MAGRILDRVGYRRALMGATGIVATGMLLTLVHYVPVIIGGLAIAATGVFICQAAASSNVGKAAASRNVGSRSCRFFRCRSLRWVLLPWRIRRLDSSRLFLEANRMVRLCSDHHLYSDAYRSDRLSILEKLNLYDVPASTKEKAVSDHIATIRKAVVDGKHAEIETLVQRAIDNQA